MTITAEIARHLREVYFGKNWTWVNIRQHTADLDWKQAVAKVGSLNTIVALVYHIDYYVCAITRVLEGKPIAANDKFSFDHPEISSQEDWQMLLNKSWENATHLASLIEAFPDNRLGEIFVDEKYGTHYRNFQGLLEHTHYHLGQIVLVKKLQNVTTESTE